MPLTAVMRMQSVPILLGATPAPVNLATPEMEKVATVCDEYETLSIIMAVHFVAYIDIDECTAGSHNCAEEATCTDTDGSFTCACRSGYSGNGQNCDGNR